MTDNPLQRVRGVIFDLNFTLVDTVRPMRHKQAIAKLIDRPFADVLAAIDQFDEDRVNGFEVGMDPRDRMEKILEAVKVDITEGLVDHLIGLEASQCFNATKLCGRNGDVPEMLVELKELGFKTGILSNGNPNTMAIARRHGLVSAVEGRAVFSCEVGASKPHPFMYQTIIDKLQLEPQQCLYVDDGGDQSLEGALAFAPDMLRVWIKNKRVLKQRDAAKLTAITHYQLDRVTDVIKLLRPVVRA